MKLRIFQSAKGDCMLLEAKSRHLVLCDGGMASSMRLHVRDELAKLRKPLELVYVSHIDQDHISGVLALLEDALEWRVYDHHKDAGTPVREPKVPRPPRIKGLLHNAFRDQIGKTHQQVEELLAAAAPALYATAVPDAGPIALELQEIATSIPEALKVSRLAAVDALDIPINRPPGAAEALQLLHAGQDADEFAVGSMKFTLIGPTKDELVKLGEGWVTWLRQNQDRVRAIRAELKRRIDRFSAGVMSESPFDLRDWNGIEDYKGVTAPNVASLMYLVEEEGKTLLLTGDAQQDFIIAGLERTKRLKPKGGVHLDVLKVQHHASEHNLDKNFARRVSARHYVFCGDGSHGNPEPDVIDLIARSRLAKAGDSARALAEDGGEFHFWFSTSSAALEPGTEQHENFSAIEQHVDGWRTKAKGRLVVHYNQGASTTLPI